MMYRIYIIINILCTFRSINTWRWILPWAWWRHQMETLSALLALCAGNSPVTSEFPSQRPVMRSFDVFFDLRLNKRLSKQSRHWWFETPSCSLWRHCIGTISTWRYLTRIRIFIVKTRCYHDFLILMEIPIHVPGKMVLYWNRSH